MNKKNQKVPKKPLIEIREDGQDYSIFVAGQERFLSQLDPGDYSHFEINESDLGKIKGSDLPSSLVLCLGNEYVYRKFQLVENVEFYYDDQPKLRIEIGWPNKLWEGFFGLMTLLEAITEQVNSYDNFEIIDSELEDALKYVTISCQISNEDFLIDSLNSVAEQYDNLVMQAEKSLLELGMAQFQQEC